MAGSVAEERLDDRDDERASRRCRSASAGHDRERVTALRPALAHPAAVAQPAVEQVEDVDVVAGGAMSASAATISVGTRRPRTSSVKSKSSAIDAPSLSSSRGSPPAAVPPAGRARTSAFPS